MLTHPIKLGPAKEVLRARARSNVWSPRVMPIRLRTDAQRVARELDCAAGATARLDEEGVGGCVGQGAALHDAEGAQRVR